MLFNVHLSVTVIRRRYELHAAPNFFGSTRLWVSASAQLKSKPKDVTSKARTKTKNRTIGNQQNADFVVKFTMKFTESSTSS